MNAYRVFVAAQIITTLRGCRLPERRAILQFLDRLANEPFQRGDYVERDEIGRPIQVLIVRGWAVCFWADHAVKEVKVLDLRPAGP
jgi:hypothetical protein